MKHDLIAGAAIVTMFAGVFLLPYTPLGLLPIVLGTMAMIIVLGRVLSNKR